MKVPQRKPAKSAWFERRHRSGFYRSLVCTLISFVLLLPTYVEGALQYVVSGRIDIEALISLGSVASLTVTIRNSLAQIGNRDVYFEQIYGTVPYEVRGMPWNVLRYKYVFFPVTGRGPALVDALKIAGGSGGTAPSPFRELLGWETKLDSQVVVNSNVSVEDWMITFSEPTVEWREVDKSGFVGTPASQELTDQEVAEIQALGKKADEDRKNSQNNGGGNTVPFDSCSPIRSACACASASGCKWDVNASGVPVCSKNEVVGSPGVSCYECRVQPHCPYAKCAAIHDPCTCMGSSADCKWWDDTFTCVQRFGGATTCKGCAKQSHCKPPELDVLDGLTPRSGSTLKGDGKALNITLNFPTPIYRCPKGYGRVRLDCGGGLPPESVPENELIISGNSFVVKLPPSSTTSKDCQLLIEDHVLCDGGGVPFLGLSAGAYTFRLSDSVAPKIAGFVPKNGNLIEEDGVVYITFDESVKVRTNMEVKLRLDGEGESTPPTASLALAPPKVVLSGKRLRIDVKDLLTPDKLYSLSLPVGCVVDLADNPFQGLPAPQYMFRTQFKASEVEEEPIPVMLIVLIATSVVFVLSCVGMLMFARYMCIQKAADHLEELHDEQVATAKREGSRILNRERSWDMMSFGRSLSFSGRFSRKVAPSAQAPERKAAPNSQAPGKKAALKDGWSEQHEREGSKQRTPSKVNQHYPQKDNAHHASHSRTPSKVNELSPQKDDAHHASHSLHDARHAAQDAPHHSNGHHVAHAEHAAKPHHSAHAHAASGDKHHGPHGHHNASQVGHAQHAAKPHNARAQQSHHAQGHAKAHAHHDAHAGHV
eukprot:TRINITY_DN26257_c0_g1_i2.p1 TRINITY_DN26257_c0_g1~~TRINITY_DN26257_c0_g1_i2.p1  ORF type:complete len:865 (-),score=88.80 TRINITY_DN26257_c0_g1_i2:281-2749(-)